MIIPISEEKRLLDILDNSPDIFSEKIRALYRAYGFKYPFCSFYIQENDIVYCSYYGKGIAYAADPEHISDRELALSFVCSGIFSEVLMPKKLFFGSHIPCILSNDIIMRKSCNESVSFISEFDKEDYETDISIGETYKIVGSGFDIDFDTWYTDTSHNVRHGISRIYSLKRRACAVRMFSSNGISFLSYVCTLPSERGRGLASSLLRYASFCEALSGCDTYLICDSSLAGFYEKAGFRRDGVAVTVKRQER